MNEQEIREALHRQGGDLITMAREIVSAGSYGPLMNAEALGAVKDKLEGIAAYAFLLQSEIEKTIAEMDPNGTNPEQE